MKNHESLNRTEVKFYRVKKGKILIEIYYIPKKIKDVVLIFCYGMPSHPFSRFPFAMEPYLRDGYILAYPHYEGTFGSDGVCTIENCVNSVIFSVNVLLNEKLYDIFTEKPIRIKLNRAILIGSSFGGSVALVAAAKSDNINHVISIAAPTNYGNHGQISDSLEYDLSILRQEMKRAYKNEWRINFSNWGNYITGELDINPVDYINQLKSKHTFLIHGEKDLCVSVQRSIDLHKKLKPGIGKHLLKIISKTGHLSTYIIGEKNIYKMIKSWL